ncbi:flavin reductase family protein [Streptomyces sp. JJ66]|uniref:flavin reductase family protein n=1 Tax=Streptomyces sp. JJ66 TaxID=2803843 RepID=UPI001C598CB0|nr:flavin reductase family protein [Streptomyces sp. JJ66]MBW1602476.1 flavin reductase family protein [Streptomyces sp. JJ66]
MPNALPVLAETDVATFRTAMGRFPTGVTLLTQGSGPDTAIITLNSLTSVSLDPLLLSVSVKADGRMRPRVERHGSFAVSVLAAWHRELGGEFARPDRPEGEAAMLRCGAVTGATGNAVIPDAVSAFECHLRAVHPAGDHAVLIGEVVAVHGGSPGAAPLVFHHGRFTTLPERAA